MFRSKISTFPTITIDLQLGRFQQINQDIKEVDVPEKTEEKALKQVDVSIQSDESNKKNVTGENALSDQGMESRRPRIKKIPRRLKSLKQLRPRLSRIPKGLMSPMILRL